MGVMKGFWFVALVVGTVNVSCFLSGGAQTPDGDSLNGLLVNSDNGGSSATATSVTSNTASTPAASVVTSVTYNDDGGRHGPIDCRRCGRRGCSHHVVLDCNRLNGVHNLLTGTCAGSYLVSILKSIPDWGHVVSCKYELSCLALDLAKLREEKGGAIIGAVEIISEALTVQSDVRDSH
ncbi:hypothetical protein DPEC_G00284790 [Dallia pectoralis]|uniref:Uncharacterized protein n=1 Tax=Dallia pectoralis TaxID=75939 RepID=A0ACC2FJJ9_DALPE|nr:hypothetical protein DPEC_G00284790 [Dallia pectoralis]